MQYPVCAKHIILAHNITATCTAHYCIAAVGAHAHAAVSVNRSGRGSGSGSGCHMPTGSGHMPTVAVAA
jgi:hypothetical protein